jgi:hypothetical protein
VAKLIYSAITSLDAYVADEDGIFDWAAPDEDVHRFVNELERPVGTYLYGRRMYEVMSCWKIRRGSPASRPSSGTTPRSGRERARSCTRERWTVLRPPGHASNGTSIPRPSGG